MWTPLTLESNTRTCRSRGDVVWRASQLGRRVHLLLSRVLGQTDHVPVPQGGPWHVQDRIHSGHLVRDGFRDGLCDVSGVWCSAGMVWRAASRLEFAVFGAVLPFAVWNTIMSFVIYLHHTHPDLKWYNNEAEWKRLASQARAPST